MHEFNKMRYFRRKIRISNPTYLVIVVPNFFSMSESTLKPVKLPYFHRTLSEEDTQLIGSTAPKRIEPSADETQEDSKLSTSSKWNSAGTWEERDCSK